MENGKWKAKQRVPNDRQESERANEKASERVGRRVTGTARSPVESVARGLNKLGNAKQARETVIEIREKLFNKFVTTVLDEVSQGVQEFNDIPKRRELTSRAVACVTLEQNKNNLFKKPLFVDLTKDENSFKTPSMVDLTKDEKAEDNRKSILKNEKSRKSILELSREGDTNGALKNITIRRKNVSPVTKHTEWIHNLNKRFDQSGLQKKLKINDEKLRAQVLSDKNKVFDEIINERLLKTAANKRSYRFSGEKPLEVETVHAMDSFFLVNLRTRGYSSVRRWTRKVDIFSFDLMPIPVHVRWCSLEESNTRSSTWTKETVKDIPQQMNGCDCGVFSCMFAEYICRGAKINFSQNDMKYFRRKMCLEIVNGKLLT
ncbi:LOW QUALITY PROTEIN: sentrin-specific protease 2-like [Ctenocephalides felis]|uniref:LOW QUALITY PROTEIN: sentrin-specific protease 2-like n=1 Tax=Ctenocephalides felis TaxID=7515 RepID=UPI000E6E2FC4|nr:LOW QUALITY PROTEIN: sentrin-specific protease 2-like [Ctenocephalides felis]